MNFARLTEELQFVAVRSRGPGGQNVNKVSSAACLYWNYQTSEAVTDWEKRRIAERMAGWINRDHQVFLRSDEFRDLEQNKSRCIEKLQDLLQRAFHVEKARKKTKPTRASKERKLEAKARRGKIKSLRRKDWSE